MEVEDQARGDRLGIYVSGCLFYPFIKFSYLFSGILKRRLKLILPVIK
jgi:hypothetical protein